MRGPGTPQSPDLAFGDRPMAALLNFFQSADSGLFLFFTSPQEQFRTHGKAF
jgi:hypothetical protein